jgi:hypothetical protein
MSQAHPDALIVTAVDEVLNRFGPAGLRELIELAQQRLVSAQATMAELGDPDQE